MGRLRTYGLLFSGMATFGSGTPVSKIVTQAFPVFLASGIRMALAAALLIPLMVLWDRRDEESALPSLSGADWARMGGIVVAGMFLFSIFMLYGMKETTGAIGGIVMATTPAITAAGSIVFLRDRLDRWKALAIGLAVGGVLAVNLASKASDEGDAVLLGSLLVFGAACGEAAYTVIGKRMTADLSPISIAAIAATLATVLFAPLAIAQIGDFDASAVEATDWLALAWWGFGTMAIGSALWYLGMKQVEGTTASAFMGVMPVSALVLSYLLLGEAFEFIHLVGMAAVLAGIASVVHSDRRS